MGRINDALLEYLQDNERFADLFNGCCFGGKKVIEAESLTEGSEIYVEHDTVSLERKTTACGKKDDQKTRQRIRDLKKWFRSGVVLRVLAVENQEHVDYAIPWRLMNYDAQEYGNQTGALKRKNRREGCLKTKGEYLCGLRREDRLVPVYTICLYHGEEIWDGPKSLKDMMDFGEAAQDWENLFSDYKIHLICLNELHNYECFHSPLRELFALIPYRKDKKALREFIDSRPEYRTLDVQTAQVAGELIGMQNICEKLENYREEEGYNMCTALKELLEDSRNEGMEKGTRDKARLVAENLYKRGFSPQEAAALLEESQERVCEWYGQFIAGSSGQKHRRAR